MAKGRKSECPLSSMADVDENLSELARLQRQVQEHEAIANEQIDRIKSELAGNTEPMLDTMKRLGAEIEEFLMLNKEDFEEDRTRELNFGRVGFRRATSIGVRTRINWGMVVESLKKRGLFGCVITKEAPDKTELAKLTDEELSMLGCIRRVKDKAWWETNVVKAAEEAVES